MDCRDVHNVSTDLQCHFVLTTDNCNNDDGYFNYLTFLYCDVDNDMFAVGIIALVLLLIVYFVGLATAADEFFCPCLKSLADIMHLSQNIAGVTILALGNGSPDIFSSIAGANQDRPELVLGELFGAGIFVTTVVVGLICITNSFKLMERPFLRDVVFYIAAAGWTSYVYYSGDISLMDSVGFILLYVVYIIVVIVSRFINKRLQKDVVNREEIMSASMVIARRMSVASTRRLSVISARRHSQQVTQGKKVTFEIPEIPKTSSSPSGKEDPPTDITIVVPTTPPTSDQPTLWRRFLGVVCEFFHGVNVIDRNLWRELTWPSKIKFVVQVPFLIVYNLAIPVVDDAMPDDGWNRPLNCFHILVLPIIVVFVSGYGTVTVVGPVQIWLIVFVVALVCAVVTFFLTSSEHPPKYHAVWAFLGFVSSVICIYVLANEIVSILKAIGVVLDISDVILGLTVLAWGNCIGDLVTDLVVARQGFPRMGISACFGGPLLNLLVGTGLSFTIVNIRSGSIATVDYDSTNDVLVFFLIASLISSLFFFPIVKFQAKRAFGIYLIVLYVLFMTLAILVSSNVITLP